MHLSFVFVACLLGSSSAWRVADKREAREALLKVLGLPMELARHSLEDPMAFKWDDCGGSGAVVKINNIIVAPDPIMLPGNVTAGFNVTSSATLSAPLKADVLLEKKVIGWIKVPCIDNIGSCEYSDVCGFLPSGDCPSILQKYHIPCHCPFAAGSYALPATAFGVQVGPLPSWLENGDYHGKASLMDESGKMVACIEAYVSLKVAFEAHVPRRSL